MKPLLLGCGVILVAFLLMGGCTVMYGVHCVNSEVALRNQAQAQSNTNQASLDTMWKIIQQKAGIVGKYTGNLKEVYKDIIGGRTGGLLFKTVQEVNPTIGPELFKDIMNSVEAERKRFLRDQTQLQDYIRERKTLCESFPSGMIIGMFGTKTEFKPKGDADTPENWPKDFQYTWVTSEATKGMVAKGEENDMKLDFGDKPAPKAEKK